MTDPDLQYGSCANLHICLLDLYHTELFFTKTRYQFQNGNLDPSKTTVLDDIEETKTETLLIYQSDIFLLSRTVLNTLFMKLLYLSLID